MPTGISGLYKNTKGAARVITLTVAIRTNLPIEAVKEHLAMYCEKMGDVSVIDVSEQTIQKQP